MARLIDTSVFIELERRRRPLSALDALTDGEPVALASISASELLIGIHRATSESERLRRLQFAEGVLSRVPILEFDLPTAGIHAWLSVELANIGQSIGPSDLIIAATAIARGCRLLTHDNHFRRVPGLQIDEPIW